MASLDDYLVKPDAPQSQAQSQAAPAQLPMGDTSAISQAATQPLQSQPQSFVSQVEGPFHTKGILGAVLGTVQDAILHDIGAPSQYWSKVSTARQADAIGTPQQWQDDPAGMYLKYANVAGVNAADDHLNNILSGQYRSAETAKATQDAANAKAIAPYQLQQAKFKAAAPFYNLAASMTDKSSPSDAAGVAATIKAGWARNQLDPSDLPTDWSPQGLKSWATQAIPGGTQVTAQNNAAYHDQRLDQIDKQIDIQQQRADRQSAHDDVMEGVAQERADKIGQPKAPKPAVDPNSLAGQKLQAQIDLARARSNKLNTAKDGTPLPGYRNPHGLVFQGGDVNNRNNWK